MTRAEALEAGAARLRAAGVDSVRLDARLLLQRAADLSFADLVADGDVALDADSEQRFDAMLRRRELREPMSHILGVRAFWGLEVGVTADVLAPRPETETLIEATLPYLPANIPSRVLDLGVGSGAILFALLSERPKAIGVGVDLSKKALSCARANAERLGLGGRVRLLHGNWAAELEEAFDLIVSNPPYIASADIEGLAPEIARFEPHLALDGGVDGLDAYRRLLPDVARLLKPGGVFALEIGAGQAQSVTDLARVEGLCVQAIIRDLADIERVIVGGPRKDG